MIRSQWYVAVIAYGRNLEIVSGRFMSKSLAQRAFRRKLDHHLSEPKRFLYGPEQTQNIERVTRYLEDKYKDYEFQDLT